PGRSPRAAGRPTAPIWVTLHASLSRMRTPPGVAGRAWQSPCRGAPIRPHDPIGAMLPARFPNNLSLLRSLDGRPPPRRARSLAANHRATVTLEHPPSTLDPEAIFAAVGEAPYLWRIDSDVVRWGSNVADVLPVADPTALMTGRRYGELIDPASGQSRFDAVMR